MAMDRLHSIRVHLSIGNRITGALEWRGARN
jgi:hypothetical protein